ncbi:ABC transporter permease [Kaistia sp. 32K]|nr:ABC transporter permease [Kaistia sp. 32K]
MLRELRSIEPPALVAAFIVLAYVVVALTAPLWAPYDPSAVMVGMPLAPPGADHLLGTDSLGRDVFSRVVLGSRPVLIMSISAALLAVSIGATLGLFAAYLGGWFDQLLMRGLDALISVPTLILGMLILSAAGNTAVLVVVTVAFINVPRIARVVRAATLAIVSEDYITSAVTRGVPPFSMVFVELLPNVLGTILVEFAVRSGFIIVFIGALGFLGFGAPPPTPEWGVMINEGRSTISVSLWPVLAPAAAMAILVVSLNLVTDAIAGRIGTGLSSRPRV